MLLALFETDCETTSGCHPYVNLIGGGYCFSSNIICFLVGVAVCIGRIGIYCCLKTALAKIIKRDVELAGLAVCDTIEHPRLHLPSGTYSIEIRHNDKLRRKVPTLIPENVRRSAFPIIGIGNGPFSLIDGSINVGQHLMAGVLVESADTFARLIDRLDKVDRRGEKIMLVIL